MRRISDYFSLLGFPLQIQSVSAVCLCKHDGMDFLCDRLLRTGDATEIKSLFFSRPP